MLMAALIVLENLKQTPQLYHTYPPLLHVPLEALSIATHTLTRWTTTTLHLPHLVSQFSSRSIEVAKSKTAGAAHPLPANFSHISYIKVYGTCRLRRIWLSAASLAEIKVPWEFDLYEAESLV